MVSTLNEGYVLHQPDPSLGTYYIDTDASQFGVGAAIYQKTEEGVIHFISFTSKKFNTAQKNYPARKRELLALINALYRWRHIIYGSPVTALVDHKSLTYIKTSKHYMILDWLNFLQQFDLLIIHRPGLKHILPDALSHLYEFAPCEEEGPEGDVFMESPEVEESPSPESSDCAIFRILEIADAEEVVALSSEWYSPSLSEAAVIARRFGSKTLGKRDPGDPEERLRIVNETHHNGPHESAYKLQQRLFTNLNYWWPELFNMCRQVTESCNACLKFNTSACGFHLAKPNPITSVNDTWGWDILDFKPASNSFSFILMIIDFASRKCWLIPLKTKEAGRVANEFMNLACNFGFPKHLQSDKDPSFCGAIMEEIKKTKDIGSKWSTPFCPWTNSIVECHAKEVKMLLRKLVKGNYQNWEKRMPVVAHYLNSRIVKSTSSCADTFYFLHKAREEHEKVSEEIELFESLKAKIEEFDSILPALATKITADATMKASCLNAARKIARKLHPHNQVLMKVMQPGKKQYEKWEGPFTVLARGKAGYVIMNELDEVRSHKVLGHLGIGLLPR